MNGGKFPAFSIDSVDLDFTGHFDTADLRAELTPPKPDRGPVVSPDLLIGAGKLVENHFFVNVSRPRPKRVVDPASITVLVMEDDNTTRNILEFMLTQERGYQVRAAGDIAGFVAAMQQKPLPDLLIFDIEFPDRISGLNILAKVRSHAVISDMPVIIFTMYSDPTHLSQGRALGVDAYLSKPARAGALTDVIRAVLGG